MQGLSLLDEEDDAMVFDSKITRTNKYPCGLPVMNNTRVDYPYVQNIFY